MKRGCIGCDNVVIGSDHLTICDRAAHPEKAPAWCPDTKASSARSTATWVLVALLCVTLGVGGFFIGQTAKDALPDTATQLASQVTVLFPSYLAYAQQTAQRRLVSIGDVMQLVGIVAIVLATLIRFCDERYVRVGGDAGSGIATRGARHW